MHERVARREGAGLLTWLGDRNEVVRHRVWSSNPLSLHDMFGVERRYLYIVVYLSPFTAWCGCLSPA